MQKTVHWYSNPRDVRSLTEKFIHDVLFQIPGEPLKKVVSAGQAIALTPQYLWVLHSGTVDIEVNDRPIMTFSEPVVFGPWFFGNGNPRVISGDDGCQLYAYDNNEVSRYFMQQPLAFQTWNGLVSAWCAHYYTHYAENLAKSVPFAPKYRTFNPGDTILKEGEFSHEVLCLVEGGADVIAHGSKVGSVKQEELFGALAALTGAPRMASVVASKPSVCMVFERDDFEDLLRSHTSLMSKLLEDMARAMHEANATIAKMGSEKARESKAWSWMW